MLSAVKQKSLQLFSEHVQKNVRRSQFSWQTVPNYRAMYSKATAAVGCPCTWHNELANDWAPLNSILANGHRFYRTLSNPLCLPEKLIWKHAPLKSEHEIYRSMWGLNPGFSDRTSRSVCTVSQPTEPLRQACHMCIVTDFRTHWSWLYRQI